jgi:hypothetical protein
VDIKIPEAAMLADLHGILWDLQRAREFASLVLERSSTHLIEPLSIAAVVMYSRPFMGGVRLRLGDDDLKSLPADLRGAHEHLRAYRDKHIAHSVNAFEENIPRANYCVERVNDEGITSISWGGGRVVGLSGAEATAIIALTTLLEEQIQARIKAEQERLLPLVRRMPLNEVLAGGQKTFVTEGLNIAARRTK